LIYNFFFKVWWQLPLFIFYYFCLFHLHTFVITFIQNIHPSPFAEASLHFLHCLSLRVKKPPWGAEPRFELGPAVQQASAIPTGPCCPYIFYTWELKIRPAGNIARPCGMFFFLAVQGTWGLNQLPFRRQFKLVAATQGTFK
jgi:hypothetical protein